jgi:hypothetical protein
MNAKVGTETTYQPVTGKHTLHEETIDNGELNCEYAESNNMIITQNSSIRKSIKER